MERKKEKDLSLKHKDKNDKHIKKIKDKKLDELSLMDSAVGNLWQPKSKSFICSQHFVGGEKSEHPHSPAYLPTIFPEKRNTNKTVQLNAQNRVLLDKMPSKKRSSRLEERLQKEAQKLKEKLEKELAPKRGSGEPLTLQCYEEELTTAQQAYYVKIQKEFKEICNKLDNTIKTFNGELVYKGDAVQSYHIGDKTPQAVLNKTLTIGKGQDAFQLQMDNRTGLIRGNMVNQANIGNETVKTGPTKKGKSVAANKRGSFTQSQVLNETNVKPMESTAIGGLATGKPAPTVDLTTEDGRPAADSKEISFNKLQGKTFPSLVVVAKPGLRLKEANATNERPALDSKVKSVLLHTPTKFTEWLIQQGLVRSEQVCQIHPDHKLQLGMYSDVSKFPYSGGYVWISECCPNRFVSVFNGSLFEGAIHPPSVLLKLIYHWACQTNIQNIIQWVKVDNLYVKSVFTCLRAICTLGINQNIQMMGGPGKKIEVGVISLGTTTNDGHQRQLKVEVLGVLDPEEKRIRLRAAEPINENNSRNRRHAKILEVLGQWVHKDSIIMSDNSLEAQSLNQMGFQNVRVSHNESMSFNQNVMDYLRRIVPRMFQNTLSLLSRQIIQQFLDELVWREWFGITAAQAFNSMVQHIADQTRLDLGESLVQHLNKIAANPFQVGTPTSTATQSNDTVEITTTTTTSKRPQRKRTAPPIVESPPPPASTPPSKKRLLSQGSDDDDV